MTPLTEADPQREICPTRPNEEQSKRGCGLQVPLQLGTITSSSWTMAYKFAANRGTWWVRRTRPDRHAAVKDKEAALPQVRPFLFHVVLYALLQRVQILEALQCLSILDSAPIVVWTGTQACRHKLQVVLASL